jgi:hypothetical protein
MIVLNATEFVYVRSREPDKDGGSPMKTSTAWKALVLGLSLSASTQAQLFQRPGTPNPRTVPAPKPAPFQGQNSGQTELSGAPGSRDTSVKRTATAIAGPVNPNELPPPTMALPNEPIEPYLLTQQAGPFMVLAHTFKGPNAEKAALALCLELRKQYQLPAYVFRPKDFPMRSMIRNIPPTAPRGQTQPMQGFPELERVKDEAAVMVGNEKSLDDSEKLLKVVKKIKPVCLDNLPDWRPFMKNKGLSHAIRTTNPYAPAEVLFPRKPDNLIIQMNGGPHSIYQCQGKFSLQVAYFTGRSDLGDSKVTQERKNMSMLSLNSSPLKTAHEDAEKLAAALARDKEVMATGYQPYVYHDRFASSVFMGGFNAPNDPGAVKLRKRMIELAVPLNDRKMTDVMIVPASALTDLTEIKRR